MSAVDPYSPDLAACRARQGRLVAEMQRHGWRQVLLTRSESVQWLTGVFLGPLWTPTAAINANGRVTLALPDRRLDVPASADEIIGYQGKWHSTFRDDQASAAAAALVTALGDPVGPTAAEWSCWRPFLQPAAAGEVADVEPTLFALRRRKDPDELRMLARANEANAAMYARAREIIEPGLNELDLYCELQRVAVTTLGEPLTYFGQDFRAAARGGAPSHRKAQAGELWILDLGVGFRGYYSDNARTIAVDRQPTPAQIQAYEALAEVLAWVATAAGHGASCRELHAEAQRRLDEHAPWVFNHHLGHGVGLAPHEGPHLNPHWDDELAVGDFFTAEPGLYHPDLNAGIRLEQNYFVTESGVDLLTPWPLELA